ncbi:TetR/AcrR family transcriptional regulator [Rhodococcus sp. T2V]|uniref:TetR/AcrR family transcriptional regulator n=1 Tax=Rhodococcus sp. T2V TaxID=3034164 RepID=UPI0023E0E2C6|nr:TetR/AcrR family transcriptional regulator [Rhodococcus sp. T2V]MDF3311911.1 TetR/AcrR family transcriptional regulator [Rhodococcus sp. T2V]
MSSGKPETRRERQRRELLTEIEAEARRQLTQGGPGAVSMRAIARAVGLGPASLYTYFDSLDEVFTLLLLGSYRSLAAATMKAVAAFDDAPPADRAMIGTLAYRNWALTHRSEFNLIFSDQLPGYQAPPGGPTIAAQTAVFAPIVDALADLDSPALPADELAVVWTAFHGAATLEVNHHLVWVDDPAAVYELAVRRAFAGAGLPTPAPDLRTRFEQWVATAHP